MDSFQKGKASEAFEILTNIIETQPNNAEAHFHLGFIHLQNKNYTESAEHFKKAINLKPHFWGSYNNLGIISIENNNIDEAIIYFQKALELAGNEPEIYFNLGNAYHEKGLFNEAISCFTNALKFKPDYEDAIDSLSNIKWDLGNKLLYSNNFKEGWKEICESLNLKRNAFTKPYWDGCEIKGKRLLIYSEWGFGDAIQFSRYIPLVIEKEAEIILLCKKELYRLFENIKGIKEIYTCDDIKILPEYDLHCPLLNMPLIFGTEKENIPVSTPYLSVKEELKEIWRGKILTDKSKFKIGLVWSGNPKTQWDGIRSIPLENFKILSGINNCSFYSLQKGPASEQLKNFSSDLKIIDLTSEINDFADTAALIENLDLVITVDTSVAHLSGALGKQTWTLLFTPPDWRWLERNGNRSFWYPNMTLFEQKNKGDWIEVLERVCECIINIR